MFRGLMKAKVQEQEALVNAAMTGQRAMTDEEQAKFQALQTEIDNLEKTIEAAAKLEAQQTALNTPVNTPVYAEPKKKAEGFSNFGEQMRAVYEAGRPENAGRVDQRLYNAASGMNESVPSDGGFLVQQDFAQGIFEKVYSTGQIMNRIKTIPIGAGRNGLKTPCVDETSRANGSRWGGIRAYWEGEADQMTGSKFKFGLLEQNLR